MTKIGLFLAEITYTEGSFRKKKKRLFMVGYSSGGYGYLADVTDRLPKEIKNPTINIFHLEDKNKLLDNLGYDKHMLELVSGSTAILEPSKRRDYEENSGEDL